MIGLASKCRTASASGPAASVHADRRRPEIYPGLPESGEPFGHRMQRDPLGGSRLMVLACPAMRRLRAGIVTTVRRCGRMPLGICPVTGALLPPGFRCMVCRTVFAEWPYPGLAARRTDDWDGSRGQEHTGVASVLRRDCTHTGSVALSANGLVLGRRRHFPKCADRRRAQTRPEEEGFLPGIQHKPCDEIIAQPLCQVMQTSEVLLALGGGGLDLNAGYLALAALQHGVDLDVVFGVVMEELHPWPATTSPGGRVP